MGNDSLVTARQIRQPIESKNDIANAFDGITYTKGASVIRMFENWAGERQFQKGVNVYLNRYAFKNARAGDVLDAVSSAANPKLTAAFSTFLEQPGLPEVSVDLKCDGAPRVALSQKRYLPIGSTGGNRQVWQTPVCVRYPGRSGPQSECFLLDKPAAEFRLTKANACPAYISANDSSSGYYVAAYQGDLFAKLLGAQHRLPERRRPLDSAPRSQYAGRGRRRQGEPGSGSSPGVCCRARAPRFRTSAHHRGQRQPVASGRLAG
jgi:alanyl aminopeptidase